MYNLDENAPESFEFVLGGHKYKMRYPNTEEVSESEKLTETKDRIEWMYSFIDPVDDGPAFAEAIKKANLKVMQNFNKMLSSELKAEV